MLTKPLRWIILLLVILSTADALATDLLIRKLVLPPPAIQLGTSAKIEFVVANVNILAATKYNINVVVRNSVSGATVFSETVTGIPIEPNTEVTHSTEQKWTATLSGAYDIGLFINFDDDINPSNNASVFSVMVSDKQILSLAAYYIMWRTMYASSFFGDAAFDLVINQPSNRWRYANVIMSLDQQATAYWILRNILIPPWVSTSPYTVSVRGDLSELIPNTTTTPPDKILIDFKLTDTPVSQRSDLAEYATIGIDYKPRYLDLSSGLKNWISIGHNTKAMVTSANTSGLKDTVYRGCTVPNIDLDSSTNNPESVPGYAGDMNACAPTAAANSMQWLENSNPNIKSGLTHRKKLEALSKAMKRENNTGVWIENFIRGKLEYIAANNLPISVKFQVRGLTKDVTNFPESDYAATAKNKGTGGYPSFDFVKKEMADSEDVETFVEYHDPDSNSSKVVGRHVITCTGAAKDSAGNRTFWYKDDGDQSNAGGTRESQVGWGFVNDSVPYIESYALGGGKHRITVPYGVVSESYDSTVKKTEKGFFDNLIGAAIGIAGRYEYGSDAVDWKKSHPIRFMHLFRRARGGVIPGVDPAPEWLVQNLPIGDVFGPATYTFVDGSNLDTTGGDSVEVRIQYSDLPLTTAPTFDGTFRWYPLATISGPSLGGALSDTVEPSLDGTISVSMPAPDGSAYTVKTDYQPNFFKHATLDNANSNDQGSFGIRCVTAVLEQIEIQRTEFTLPPNVREQLMRLTDYSSTLHGVTRGRLMSGLLSFIDDERLPVSGRFQCAYQRTGSVPSPRPYGHQLLNQSDTDVGVTWDWLTTQIQKGPILLEVGMVDVNKRQSGYWVLLTGIVEHNGLRRLLTVTDVDEGAPGGLRHLVGTAAESNHYLYVAEWSTASQRAHLISAISLEYDPTVTFTGVEEPVRHDAFDITAVPQPATESLRLRWSQTRSLRSIASIVDITGSVVATVDITSATRDFDWTVNVQNMAAGHYRLIIRSDAGITGMPIVIIH